MSLVDYVWVKLSKMSRTVKSMGTSSVYNTICPNNYNIIFGIL